MRMLTEAEISLVSGGAPPVGWGVIGYWLVAGITGMDALIPTPIRFQAIRTDFGRPNSSIRFRAFTAMAASVV